MSDANYTSRYIRNRLTSVTMKVGDAGTPTTLATVVYDAPGGAHPCGVPPAGTDLTVVAGNVYLHDPAYVSAVYRGNPTSAIGRSGQDCKWYDYLGVSRSGNGVSGTSVVTLDPERGYTVPSAITANGYTTNLSWDAALNLTSVTGPNNATSAFGYDAAGRYTSSTDPDGATSSSTYTMATPGASGVNYSWTGKRFTRTTLDGLGRAAMVETGYAPTPGNYVVESVVETQYAPCACTPLGKMKRVSQPRKPADPAVWTTYTYDELGRVKTITLPPNTGTSGNSGVTNYEYVLNTVKVTDPAGRWKKYAMDGFGNLVSVEEPKPAGGGSYVAVRSSIAGLDTRR